MEKSAEPRTTTVAVPRDLANLLRIVAAHRKQTMTETLDALLRPVVDRAYKRAMAVANVELGESGA